MICQRCGNCCVTMDVVVYLNGRASIKPGNVRCPNLEADGKGTFRCAVHELPEYKGSPCWVYGNSQVDPDFICKRGKPCQVGRLWIDHKGGFPVPEHTTEPLEDLGPWRG